MEQISIVLIEDDPMVREVNRQFIERVAGFEIVATASNGVEGLEKIAQYEPHLVLMDVFMPQLDGVSTLQSIRKVGYQVDVIAITAANDRETISRILQLGAFDYIMKPFTFERIEQTLKRYMNYKTKLHSTEAFTQQQLDQLLQRQQVTQQQMKPIDEELPKGFNKATMEKVLQFIETSDLAVSADDVAATIGVARVTARRYLDFMEKSKMIGVDSMYGNVGRPMNMYFKKK